MGCAESKPTVSEAAPAAAAELVRAPSAGHLPVSRQASIGKHKNAQLVAEATTQDAKRITKKTVNVLQRDSENFFDLYTLGRELGKGQFGVVQECLSKTSGQRFAVKVIAKHKMKTTEEVEDVRREVAIMHHLGSKENEGEHVVFVHDAYEDSRAVYLVMELCEGGELFDRIVELGHYSEAKAASLFRNILQMLHHCHTLGVVHRDLKPENFLLSAKGDRGVLKATDFGLSAFYKTGDVLNEMVGSPYYVAPEVLNRCYGIECDMWSAGVILYILLGGLPPFWGDNERAIFDSILRDKVDFSEDPWPSISASAKDLICQLLDRDVRKRMTVEQALEHPWLLEGGASDEKLHSEVLKRMRTFANQSKFKQLGMMMLVKHLKKEELEGLRQLFLELDDDKSGTITVDELRTGLDHHGAHLAKSEVEALMDSLDVDGSHELSYDEFMAATVQMHKLESQQNLHQAFEDFDDDSSGSISPEELATKLVELGIKASREEVLKMIDEVDTNHDGSIDYNEFVALMCPRLLHGHDNDDGTMSASLSKLKFGRDCARTQ